MNTDERGCSTFENSHTLLVRVWLLGCLVALVLSPFSWACTVHLAFALIR